jgi:hypothetical protein
VTIGSQHIIRHIACSGQCLPSRSLKSLARFAKRPLSRGSADFLARLFLTSMLNSPVAS